MVNDSKREIDKNRFKDLTGIREETFLSETPTLLPLFANLLSESNSEWIFRYFLRRGDN